jgi:hypothetical protein
MLKIIHSKNRGAPSAPPEDSGIKRAADGLGRALQEELMEQQGYEQK